MHWTVILRYGQGIKTKLSNICDFASVFGLEGIEALWEVALREDTDFLILCCLLVSIRVAKECNPVFFRQENFADKHLLKSALLHLSIKDLSLSILAYTHNWNEALLATLSLHTGQLDLIGVTSIEEGFESQFCCFILKGRQFIWDLDLIDLTVLVCEEYIFTVWEQFEASLII